MNNNYQPNNQYGYQKPEPAKSQGVVSMVLGILSIWFGFIPGLIMGSIACNKAGAILDVNPYCEAAKFAKVGRITGKIGLILSIITTVIIVLYLFIYFVAIFSILSMY